MTQRSLAEEFEALPRWERERARVALRKLFTQWAQEKTGEPAVRGTVVRQRRSSAIHNIDKEK
jgi:hypothetical protein